VNYNPDKEPFLDAVETMRRQRLYSVRLDSLRNLEKVVPVQKVAEDPEVNSLQGIVGMNLREQDAAQTAHETLGDYSRDVIDRLFEDKNAA
jgi:hypothetical protein